MTDPDALLRSVLAAPADELPRLVYADWLEEHGDPAWAAAVRVMCAAPHEFDAEVQTERMGAGRPPAEVAAVLSWLETHAPDHLSLLLGGRRCEPAPVNWVWRTWCPDIGLVAEWRRGLITRVQGPIEAVQTHLPRFVAAHPVEWAGVTNRRPESGSRGGPYWFADEPDDTADADESRGDELNRLPWSLAKRFETKETGRGQYRGFVRHAWRFGSNAEADAALSAALLAEARDVPV